MFDIFDIHQHVGDTGLSHGIEYAGALAGVPTEASAEAVKERSLRLKMMDEGGIGQSLVMPGFGYDRSDGAAATRAQNDGIAAYRDSLSGRFPVAAGVIEPLDLREALNEVRRAQDLGLVGITLHTEYQGVTLESSSVLRVLEAMQERGLIPLLHAPDDSLSEKAWRLAKVARMFPDMTFLALEPFFTMEGMQAHDLVADVAPNVLFDTASCYDVDWVVEFARKWGAERVLYGSHMYSVAHESGINRAINRRNIFARQCLLESDLSQEQKALIFGGNARKLFGLDGGITD